MGNNFYRYSVFSFSELSFFNRFGKRELPSLFSGNSFKPNMQLLNFDVLRAFKRSRVFDFCPPTLFFLKVERNNPAFIESKAKQVNIDTTLARRSALVGKANRRSLIKRIIYRRCFGQQVKLKGEVLYKYEVSW